MDEKTIARFWSKVDKNGPIPPHMPHLGQCWVWTAGQANGYGRLCFWSGSRRVAVMYAHRISWVVHRGTLLDELCVLHHCDNTLCVNPEHLFLGSRTDNAYDKVSKGRARGGSMPGEQSPNAKLTEEAIRTIRAGRTAGRSLNTLAREHGVSKKLILRIVQRLAWKHVV
ncbi:MAG: hypothetical protein AMXMBFR56_67890 [Polyangiaceae bacterium]